jgi:hypothetical protein
MMAKLREFLQAEAAKKYRTFNTDQELGQRRAEEELEVIEIDN